MISNCNFDSFDKVCVYFELSNRRQVFLNLADRKSIILFQAFSTFDCICCFAFLLQTISFLHWVYF